MKRDPAYNVTCPKCKAKPGRRCWIKGTLRRFHIYLPKPHDERAERARAVAA